MGTPLGNFIMDSIQGIAGGVLIGGTIAFGLAVYVDFRVNRDV